MDFDEYAGRIALTMIPGIGPVISKKLVLHCGSASSVFAEKKKNLELIPGIGSVTARLLRDRKCLLKAEKELKRIESEGIQMLYFTEKNYPSRLKHCYDSPPLLYYKGSANLNSSKVISVIGTRNITEYGKEITEKLIAGLQSQNVLVVSGLAYGVDICAHRKALEYGLETVGVLAHGLDRIYPSAHASTAKKMMKHGGLLSDFPCETNPDRENFPQRNRIVAGLADAVIVIESGESGGSMITAEFANNYNRDVFAYPGRITDNFSAGCHKLIRTHKANLATCADDIAQFMGWEEQSAVTTTVQTDLKILSPDEETIAASMRGLGNVHIDEISGISGFSPSKVSALLLQMEFSGSVKSLPGKFYRLI